MQMNKNGHRNLKVREYIVYQGLELSKTQVWSSGYDARFTRERSRVQSSPPVLILFFIKSIKSYFYFKS
jgi:hypothetical protein